jgi:hypothetical protein
MFSELRELFCEKRQNDFFPCYTPLRLVLYGRKKKSHFAGKMDFLAEGKYTEKSHLKKVILSKEWFLPQKVIFFPYNMKKKTIFHVTRTKMTVLK